MTATATCLTVSVLLYTLCRQKKAPT